MTDGADLFAADRCQPCAGRAERRSSGRYDLRCVACCVALLREAPAGPHRQATAAHLASTCPDGVWAATVKAAKREGLTK
jgi:hypothetical protein